MHNFAPFAPACYTGDGKRGRLVKISHKLNKKSKKFKRMPKLYIDNLTPKKEPGLLTRFSHKFGEPPNNNCKCIEARNNVQADFWDVHVYIYRNESLFLMIMTWRIIYAFSSDFLPSSATLRR